MNKSFAFLIPAAVMMWARTVRRFVHHQNFYDKYLVGGNKTGKEVVILSDIIDMARFSALPPSEIATVWQEHYLKKPGKTGFSIPEDTSREWQENSLRWPNMIVPLIRSPGSAENYFAQHNDKELGMTTLVDFQKFGPASQPSIRVQIFDDLAVLKGLSLLLVHFDESANREQAENLVKSLIRIYVKQPVWPQTFNERPSEFDYNAFLESR